MIAASNVTLDLNSHLVNGEGAPAAISTSGFANVSIKNGAVTNPGSLAIQVTNESGFVLDNVQVFGSNQAFVMTGCNTSDVNSLSAYNNSNVSGPVVLIDNSDSIDLFDVEVNNNTKALAASVGTTDPAIGILAVNNSSNVTLTDCTTNHNTQTNDNNRFAPLVSLFSESVSFIHCTSNSNNFPVNDFLGFAPIHVRASIDTKIEGCQVNQNTILSTDHFLRGIYLTDSPRNVIKNCQINDNNAALLAVSGIGLDTDVKGIFVFAASAPFNDTIIAQCQCSGNFVTDGGTRTLSDGFGQAIGITLESNSGTSGFEDRTVIDSCQLNDNTMVSQATEQLAAGLLINRCIDVVVSNNTFNGNNGGSEAYGILVFGNEDATPSNNPARKISIIDCTANDTLARDLAIGIFLGGFLDSSTGIRTSTQNSEIVDSQALRNIAGTNGFGIALQNTNDCTIEACLADGNSSTGIFAGSTGSLFNNDPGPLNSNNVIINTTSRGNGANGFALTADGTNDNFLIQDNFAIANTVAGFRHNQTVLTSAFIGNYARKNALDYVFSGGTLQIHSLSLATGLYTPLFGDTTLTKLTNLTIVP